MHWHVFQSTDNVAKDPPVKVDLTTEVHKPFSLNEVYMLNDLTSFATRYMCKLIKRNWFSFKAGHCRHVVLGKDCQHLFNANTRVQNGTNMQYRIRHVHMNLAKLMS